jgi:hypothetical protein
MVPSETVVPGVVIMKSSVVKAAVAESSDDWAGAAVEATSEAGTMETAAGGAPVTTSIASHCHCWRGHANGGNS